MNNNNKSKDRREEIEFRALVSKGHALLDREIIETFLSGAHDGVEASIIAERLMDRFKGIGRISSLEIDDLKTIEGVTNSTVTAILCLKEALKRVPREELKKGPVIGGNLEKLVEYLKACIGHLEKECTIIIYLDQKFHLIGETVYVGKKDSVPICIHEVARKAIIEKAKLMIMSHNHPCGSLKPSDEDLAVTKKLAEACKTIEIRLYDHIIITSASYLSLKKEGLL
ncbi:MULTISPECIES: JAB domain-containing protein [unclassified Wolbachia]|uniref:JAB domain-containing protein n=1 Tax=unclassified Wolbachia TaxID=2640676 RepID=UPI002227B47D|nr:JAB domain-containing protein [Wolbachia endosymbiont (group A) of Lasioglossum morio]